MASPNFGRGHNLGGSQFKVFQFGGVSVLGVLIWGVDGRIWWVWV